MGLGQFTAVILSEVGKDCDSLEGSVHLQHPFKDTRDHKFQVHSDRPRLKNLKKDSKPPGVGH